MKRTRIAAAALALTMLISAGASSGGDFHPRHKPTDQAIVDYFPDRAYRMGVQGEALISCGVDDQARLTNCIILDQQPANQAFGFAALKLASRDMVNPPVGTPPQTDGYHLLLTFCESPQHGIYATYPPSGPKPPCVK